VRDLRDGIHEVTYRLNTAGRYMMYIEMLEPSMRYAFTTLRLDRRRSDTIANVTDHRDETWSPVAVGPVDVASQQAAVASAKPGSATRLGHNTPVRSTRPKL
jgi:hypothetical protein